MVQKARVAIAFEVPSELQDAEAAFIEQTLQLQDGLNLTATWASQDVLGLRDLVHPYRQKQEVALAAPRELSDRTEFAAWLLNRMHQAETNRFSIRTLLADSPTVVGHCDLLVKHRINSLATRGSVTKQDELERFGVLVAPPPIDLCGEFPWWSGGPKGAVRRALHQAIQQGDFLHLAVDVRKLVQRNREECAWAALQDAGHRNRHGLAQVASFGELALRHRILRTGTSRSVLRAA